MHSVVLPGNSFEINSIKKTKHLFIFCFSQNISLDDVNFWIKQQLFTEIVDYAI